MKTVKILSWFGDCYLKGLFEKVKEIYNIQYRDTTDFGLKGIYSSNIQQSDFDALLQVYMPDIMVLVDRTSRNLSVDIPENIKVLIFCDHFHEQFCIFGQAFFDRLPRNNYLLYPILDMHNMDRDKVMIWKKAIFHDRVFAIPFMPCIEDIEGYKDGSQYECDISVMLRYKKINYYYSCYGINVKTFPGKMLMQFLSELIVTVRNQLKQSETAYMEDKYIMHLVQSTAEHLHLAQHVSNFGKFLQYWFNEVKYNIISTEYANQIVDWLVEGGYNIKIYGAGWKDVPKYKEFAFGEITDGSADLRLAYQHSKISIGTGASMGLHRRVFEAMENGSLCLQAEICKDLMFSDWRHYFEDGKDIVIFHDKNELYQKVDYFLSHTAEREQIVDAAREKIKGCPDLTKLVWNVITTLM